MFKKLLCFISFAAVAISASSPDGVCPPVGDMNSTYPSQLWPLQTVSLSEVPSGTDTLQNGTNAIVSGGTSQIQSSSGQSTHRRVMAAILNVDHHGGLKADGTKIQAYERMAGNFNQIWPFEQANA
ncbi:uncharacterized protein BT62DRAFT_918622 [Guyanagaster necrorhizus]|uniref:Uncharacterized protein n=1 Tax=Guyanagaster necrorhizus TaxID=856835 RepID=A0A9P7VX27_9AGAR|nr:uncharacterized protein BT62DRAFT_918622 [Guyanagaster necrorhizus MCA 3950]KAG7448193.1 hypothetical protein BT62DRAFT_918622 [Guyanagaster necrorhizus MCA 3950]